MKLPITIYEVVVPKGKRSTKTVGYFTNKQVAESVAAQHEPLVVDNQTYQATVNTFIADQSDSIDEFKKSSAIRSALEKLTSEERTVLGI